MLPGVLSGGIFEEPFDVWTDPNAWRKAPSKAIPIHKSGIGGAVNVTRWLFDIKQFPTSFLFGSQEETYNLPPGGIFHAIAFGIIGPNTIFDGRARVQLSPDLIMGVSDANVGIRFESICRGSAFIVGMSELVSLNWITDCLMDCSFYLFNSVSGSSRSVVIGWIEYPEKEK